MTRRQGAMLMAAISLGVLFGSAAQMVYPEGSGLGLALFTAAGLFIGIVLAVREGTRPTTPTVPALRPVHRLPAPEWERALGG